MYCSLDYSHKVGMVYIQSSPDFEKNLFFT